MHDKDFFKNFDFCTSFYFSTIETLFWNLYFKLVHGSINLLLLKIMCHLKNYCRICQIWTTSAQSNGVKFVKKWYSCNWVLFKTLSIQLDVILNILFMNHESPHALDMFYKCARMIWTSFLGFWDHLIFFGDFWEFLEVSNMGTKGFVCTTWCWHSKTTM
jgi:hypothetical protein